MQRAPQITIQNTYSLGANLPQILGRTIYDRITVQYEGQTAGSTFAQDSLIESIEHDVDISTGIWAATFAQSPYEISLVQLTNGALTSINTVPIELGVWKFGSSGYLLL